MTCTVWPMGAAWLCLHLWEHYRFGGDADFLRERAYPVMKEAAVFLLDYMTVDEEETDNRLPYRRRTDLCFRTESSAACAWDPPWMRRLRRPCSEPAPAISLVKVPGRLKLRYSAWRRPHGLESGLIINYYARSQRGAEAHEQLVHLLASSTYPNLLDCHPPFKSTVILAGLRVSPKCQSHTESYGRPQPPAVEQR